jgi:hypothetical protein
MKDIGKTDLNKDREERDIQMEIYILESLKKDIKMETET